MKPNIFLQIVLIFLLFASPAGICEENYTCTRTDGLIRVGISSNNFSQLQYKDISLSSEGRLEIFDRFLNEKIYKTAPDDILKFNIKDTTIFLTVNGKKLSKRIFGPIIIKPLEEFPVKVVGLNRKGKQAAYRGNFEIIRSKKGKFFLVNVLPLEEYLKGVVPNELPPSFGEEALKAQAIAARNYAIRPRVKRFPQFDVCDSVSSQVYFGYNTEAEESNRAIQATKGLVALYDGEVILALYSSASGGYTENFENAFSEPGGGKFPADPLPYLKGKPDNPKTPPLLTDKLSRKFYTSNPSGYDVNSRYYRWTRTWTAEEMRRVLNNRLSQYPSCELISPRPKKGMDIGKIKAIKILERGVSGKIIAIRVRTEKGDWIIKKELLIRRIFKNQGKALPSANFVVNNYIDKDGFLYKFEIFGGGYGHGVGMSQYGASYMSGHGYTFDQILQHYYTDIAIGTWPVYMASEYTVCPVKQDFFSPEGKADLLIENFDSLNNFDFMINSQKISLKKQDLQHEKIRIPLNKFVKKGINEIIYYPLDEVEEKSVKVWVEVFRMREPGVGI